MKLSKVFMNGLISENAIFVQLIGMCSVLAVSTSAINSISMGIAVITVLVGSNVAISLLKKFIPNEIRIPVFVIVIATFVTIVQMFLNAYAPDIYAALGIFIPLIVVNCLILGRAEAFAYKNGVIASVVDGIGMGLGFTMAITILGSLREILGAGSIFGVSLFGDSFQPIAVFVAPPGAFILLGVLIAIYRTILKKAATN